MLKQTTRHSNILVGYSMIIESFIDESQLSFDHQLVYFYVFVFGISIWGFRLEFWLNWMKLFSCDYISVIFIFLYSWVLIENWVHDSFGLACTCFLWRCFSNSHDYIYDVTLIPLMITLKPSLTNNDDLNYVLY